ncbi:hypothetical protein Hypma_009322 [Hypsizygus marmoreus]|uniref:F-box domain-containing protein n=1 Tax=Hypsizygus marmoreus TaxID=39966 RepID=A0A369JX55_HYPMA|nr:hypothetical protein Hypma_009322 [Hypsizygus marmoreus]
MHECLRINEILSNIFEHLFEQRPPGLDPVFDCDIDPEKALFRLAITCRTFTEPALDELWKVQRVLKPLIRCMPADLWSDVEGKPLTFTRALQATDWERFDFYARRIRELGYAVLPYTLHATAPLEASTEVFAALAAYVPVRIFLPRLCIIRCTGWGIALYPHIQAFIGEAITRVVINRKSVGYHKDGILTFQSITPNIIGALCSAFSRLSPNITHLDIDGGQDFERPYLDLLNGLERLRGLSISIEGFPADSQLGEEFVRLVADCKFLEDLSIDEISSDQIHQFHTRNGQFPKLCTFWFTPQDLTAVGTVVQTMQCRFSNLSMRVSTDNDATYSLTQLHQSLIPFSNHACRRTLVTIELETSFDKYLPCTPGGPTVADALQPLLDCPNLRDVLLELDCTADLEDSWLEAAGKAWPRLTQLKLWTHTRYDPKATLAGIPVLLDLCPYLEVFQMRMDATFLPPPDLLPDVQNHEIELLYLVGSPIDSPREVAMALKRMFPNLRSANQAVVEGCDVESEDWEEVDEILGELS